jgi:hypothetical protein
VSNVVKFPFNAAGGGGVASMLRRHRVKREARVREIGAIELTETAKNSRLRDARKTAWYMADRTRDYWRARLDWHSSLETARNAGVTDALKYPDSLSIDRWDLVHAWRAALVVQLLTPAPKLNDVTWKQRVLASGELQYCDVPPERVQKSIDADIAWLDAHPTKKSKPMSTEAKEHRRNFKEAMRRRIKDIAASRDIPDDEIRPVLSLKHRHIGEFAIKYSVNLEWLLEGKGRIFKKDPIKAEPEHDRERVRCGGHDAADG